MLLPDAQIVFGIGDLRFESYRVDLLHYEDAGENYFPVFVRRRLISLRLVALNLLQATAPASVWERQK